MRLRTYQQRYSTLSTYLSSPEAARVPHTLYARCEMARQDSKLADDFFHSVHSTKLEVWAEKVAQI